jgi:hypothetical protein
MRKKRISPPFILADSAGIFGIALPQVNVKCAQDAQLKVTFPFAPKVRTILCDSRTHEAHANKNDCSGQSTFAAERKVLPVQSHKYHSGLDEMAIINSPPKHKSTTTHWHE